MGLRDRDLVGAGAAACAVCCAAPILGFLGIAGATAATTYVFAGLTFAVVVGLLTLAGVIVQRRRAAAAATCGTGGPVRPVAVELSPAERRPGLVTRHPACPQGAGTLRA